MVQNSVTWKASVRSFLSQSAEMREHRGEGQATEILSTHTFLRQARRVPYNTVEETFLRDQSIDQKCSPCSRRKNADKCMPILIQTKHLRNKDKGEQVVLAL